MSHKDVPVSGEGRLESAVRLGTAVVRKSRSSPRVRNGLLGESDTFKRCVEALSTAEG